MTSDIKLRKQALRGAMRARLKTHRKGLSSAQQHQATASVCRHLESVVPRAKGWVGLYVATSTEPDLSAFRRWTFDHAIPCAVPAWDPDQDAYRWALWPDQPSQSWVRGPHGASEPATRDWMEPGAEWLLVPGLAFDSQGTRLGHGGGFIDRLLASEPEALSIGCGWECQWCDHPLPQEDHDRPIAHVVTEAGIHSI